VLIRVRAVKGFHKGGNGDLGILHKSSSPEGVSLGKYIPGQVRVDSGLPNERKEVLESRTVKGPKFPA
jgi:hypothetical protein